VPGRPHPNRRLTLTFACAVAAILTPAAQAGSFHRDRTPLPSDVTGASGARAAAHVAAGTGGAAVHMLLGLAVVVALIFGIYKLLRRSADKNDKTVKDDGFIRVVSSTPLAASRSLHLVRVGDEIVLVASSEQSVTPVRVYARDEARRLGIDPDVVAPGLALAPAAAARPSFSSALLESVRRMTAR
jgi:flagellar biogenesis protein FliO